MKKIYNIKNLIAGVLVLTMIFQCGFVNAANDTKDAVLTTRQGAVISEELRDKIIAMNVEVNKNTEIDFVSLTEDEHASAVVITNKVGNLMIKDTIVVLDEDGKFQDLEERNRKVESGMRKAGGSGDYITDKITIRGTAVFNRYNYIYYQPIGAYFIYEKHKTCSVSSISATYECCGYEYTYPGFNSIGTGGIQDLFQYDIKISKSNPNPNTIYDKTSPYTTSRVIQATTGSPVSGQYFSYKVTVDSQTRSTTVNIFNN